MFNNKKIFNIVYPILLEQLFFSLIGIVNTIMVSKVGQEAVAGISMVDSINLFIMNLFTCIGIGATIVVSQYRGRGDIKQCKKAALQSMASSLIMAIATSILLLVLNKFFLVVLFGGAEQGVINNGLIYLIFSALAYPLIAISTTGGGILRGNGFTKTPLYISIIMNVVNVIGGVLFIYILDLGVFGAGLAMIIARLVAAVQYLYDLIIKRSMFTTRQIREFKFDKDMQKLLMTIGVPAGVESIIFNGGKLITQIFIVKMGTASMAANAIASSIFGFINIPAGALSIATMTIIGQCIGAGNKDEAKELLKKILIQASGILFVISLIFFPLVPYTVNLYAPQVDVYVHVVKLLKLVLIASPLTWPTSFILSSGLKAAGDVKYTTVVSIASMWAFRVIAGYIFGITLGLDIFGVWLAMCLDWVIRSILFVDRYRRESWLNIELLSSQHQ